MAESEEKKNDAIQKAKKREAKAQAKKQTFLDRMSAYKALDSQSQDFFDAELHVAAEVAGAQSSDSESEADESASKKSASKKSVAAVPQPPPNSTSARQAKGKSLASPAEADDVMPDAEELKHLAEMDIAFSASEDDE